MAVFDRSSEIKPVNALNHATISSDTTTAGVIIDTYGYDSVTFILRTGAYTAGNVTPLIQDGDDSALGDAAAVSDDFLIGTEAAAALSAANKTSKIGYVGKKRYVRLSAVTASSANLGVGAIAILGDARTLPESDQTP